MSEGLTPAVRRGDGPLPLRHDAKVPLAVCGRDGEVLHQLLDVERLGIRLVADLEHGPALFDVVPVDIAAEELPAMQTASDRGWDVGREEFLFPENRVLAA
jgi:hypothetical protein